jgi:putative NADH-flavin reductase
VVQQALEAGHEVSVLVRSQASADTLGSHERLITVLGRLEEPGDVDAVVHGAAAVVSALGAATNGPTTVCADGARAILQAMRRHGVRRLLVVSAHGVAESHDHSAYVHVVWGLRGHRMRDKEVMEDLIAGADVAATVVRVPALSDGQRTGRYLTGTDLRVGAPTRCRERTSPTSCSPPPSPVPTWGSTRGSSGDRGFVAGPS